MGAIVDLHILIGLAIGWLCCRVVAHSDTWLFLMILLACYAWGEPGIYPAVVIAVLIGFADSLRRAVMVT